MWTPVTTWAQVWLESYVWWHDLDFNIMTDEFSWSCAFWKFFKPKDLKVFLKQHYVTWTITQCFKKRTLMMHINTLHKTAILVKPSHILWRKCPLVFSLMSYDCSVCLQPFILAELSPATTRCCSCSFSLQAAYMLLSGTSVYRRIEAKQSQDIRGKTRGHFLHKIWPGFTKITVLCVVLTFWNGLV